MASAAVTATERRYMVNDLKYFLYTCTINENFNPIKTNAGEIIDFLIRNGHGDEIIKVIIQYANLNNALNSTNIDAATYVLAYCVKVRHNEKLTNSAYNALKEISETPLYLFSFAYYHKYLLEEEAKKQPAVTNIEKKYGKGWGKGQRKAVIKWYNDHCVEDMLRLVTKYRHSHTWSHKDVIRIAHIKPANDGVALIFKYLLFGFQKIENEKINENEKHLFEFLRDFENLKHAQTGSDACVLIRKHKFHLEHLPTIIHKNKEIWEALVEDMTLQQLCNYICVLTSKGLLKPGTSTEKFILEKILTREQAILSKIHPIYPCLALQIYLHVSKLGESNEASASNITQSALIKDALFNVFQLTSNTQNLSSNKRISCIIEHNPLINTSQTDGLRVLNPLHVCSALALTLRYTENVCDFYLINDKLNELNLPPKEQNISLESIESTIKGYSTSDKNANESVFEWCIKNKKLYDCFIFLISSSYNEKTLVKEIETYRSQVNLPNAKLVLISLSGKISLYSINNLNLNFKGWNIDSYLVLQSYLNDRF